MKIHSLVALSMITLQEPTEEDITTVHTNYNVWYQGLFEQKVAPTIHKWMFNRYLAYLMPNFGLNLAWYSTMFYKFSSWLAQVGLLSDDTKPLPEPILYFYKHSLEANLTQTTILYNELENYTLKLLPHLPVSNELTSSIVLIVVCCQILIRSNAPHRQSCQESE